MAKTVRWRNVDVDPETAAFLIEFARIVGDDMYVQGIPGFGSYRNNPASGATDTGGGHVDINLVGFNEEQCRRAETRARSIGGAAFWRPARRADGTRYGWQEHLHILRIDTVDLSANARVQVNDYMTGWSGLPIGGRVLRDSGNRSYTQVRWGDYKKRMQDAAKPQPPVVIPDIVLPKEEEDMATPAEIWNYQIPSPLPGGYSTTALSWLRQANIYAEAARTLSAQNAGQIAGLSKVVQQLAVGQDIDMDAILSAAKAGAEEALKQAVQIDIGIVKK